MADAYTAANPDVKINLQPYPFAQFFQVAELRLRSADAGIDLVYVDAPLLAAYASRGFLSPIEASVDTSSLVESALEAGKYDGTQFALPINNSAQVMFYNKALFQGRDHSARRADRRRECQPGRGRRPRRQQALDMGTGG